MPNTSLDTRVLDAIIKNSNGNVAQAVAKAGFAIEGRAKINAPVDTGALRASIYTSVKEGTQRPAPFTGANYVALPTPPDNTTVYVGPSVEYAAAVHFGTHDMEGRPFLLEALRATENDFRGMVRTAVTNGG